MARQPDAGLGLENGNHIHGTRMAIRSKLRLIGVVDLSSAGDNARGSPGHLRRLISGGPLNETGGTLSNQP